MYRAKLDRKQKREIEALYKALAEKTAKRTKELEGRTNISSILRKQYLEQMEKELNLAIKDIGAKTNKTIRKNMEKTAKAVVNDNVKWMESLGLSPNIAFLNIPKDVVLNVANGKLYEGNWSLSKAIWGDNKATQKEINKIIAAGIAENKSAYDIAKDLELYVDPTAIKPWDWGKVYPGTRRKIDYNAQRLARTMVSHAYQKALVDTVKPNPFVTGIKWRSAHSVRTCQLCNDRDGQVYKKEELPLDHPNGMCTYLTVGPSMNDIADRLGDWVNGKSDSALDDYAKYLKGERK